ncbi:hypothetical protein [Serratia marcescens]|uniref:hypothetical protein n=1 Tax=Serratia marcescens TaxID=615 RepID=UPI000F7F21E8|nr:hypothetical protein [Serratia marcescens]
MHLNDFTEATPALVLEEIKIVQIGMQNHASACTVNYRHLICFRRALLPLNHLIFWAVLSIVGRGFRPSKIGLSFTSDAWKNVVFWAAEGVLVPEWLPVVAHTGLCSW